jgi:hypothetical protein
MNGDESQERAPRFWPGVGTVLVKGPDRHGSIKTFSGFDFSNISFEMQVVGDLNKTQIQPRVNQDIHFKARKLLFCLMNGHYQA